MLLGKGSSCAAPASGAGPPAHEQDHILSDQFRPGSGRWLRSGIPAPATPHNGNATTCLPITVVAHCRPSAMQFILEPHSLPTNNQQPPTANRRVTDAPPAAGSSSIKVSVKGDAKSVAVNVKAGSASARASYAPATIRK